MRLSMSVNGATPRVASLSGPGYLSAELKMSDRPKGSEHKKEVHIGGFETGETETVHLKWPSFDLKVGDVVELRVLPDGEGDAPTEIRKSSESPYNLLSSTELAKQVLEVVAEFEERLTDLLYKSEELEPPEEHEKFRRAWGTVGWELGQNLLYPVYRRHKELIPEELKGTIL
jgi:hypothetical protein